MPIWVSAEKFAAGLADVRAHAEDAGRDPAAIAAAVVCPALLGDDAGPRLAAHLELRYGMTVESHLVDRYCVAGSPEECAARVREYADAGAEHVIFNIGCAAGDELLDQAAALPAASTTLRHSVARNNVSRLEVS
jgi:alkanesulfonate monooxygenase SsuD/methylene tetrahydromethanopterin reductase-like flavin-dependent oxidoreductase (luciferase family)